jgi:hypothetical protein
LEKGFPIRRGIAVYGGMDRHHDRQDAHPSCPSLLDITRYEAGELAPLSCANLRAHAADCSHCGGILSLIECARLTLLGTTRGARIAQAHRAAALLLTLVERRRLARS